MVNSDLSERGKDAYASISEKEFILFFDSASSIVHIKYIFWTWKL